MIDTTILGKKYEENYFFLKPHTDTCCNWEREQIPD